MDYCSNIDHKTIANSLTWKTSERIISQGMSLIIQVVLARLLVPDDFGTLAIVAAITNYAAVFVQSGLATAIVQKEDLDDLDISTLLIASLGTAFLFYILLFAAAPIIAAYYDSSDLVLIIRILSLILFLNAVNSVQTAILTRRMQFKILFFRSLIAVPISGTVGILMAQMQFGVWALVAQQLSNVLIVVIVMSIGTDMRIKPAFSIQRAKKIYAFSGKILISSLVSGLYDALRTMTIGRKYSSEALAYYDKAYTYSFYLVQIINGSITSVLLPVFSRKQTNLDELRTMARKSTSLAAFVMFPILLGVAAIAKPLISILLTEKWIACVPYLVIFCILRLPGCVMSIDKQVYYALGRSGINLIYESVLCIVNLSVLIFLMPYGPFAIAVGAMLTELLGCAVIFFISAKVYGYTLVQRFNDLGKAVLNSTLMSLAVWRIGFLPFSAVPVLFIQILSGVAIYIILARLTRDKNINNSLLIIRNVIKK